MELQNPQKHMVNTKNQTVLITGATSGIGYELAHIFASHGYNLILVARRADRLEKIKTELEKGFGVSVITIVKDLSHPTATEEIAEEIKKQNRDIDILINNAGMGVYGNFSHTEREKELSMIKLNITALTDLTKLLLGGMVERRKGKILNVASTAAFQPGPKMAVYFASKAYVLSFSEALREEMKQYGITVSCLCPGSTKTEFWGQKTPWDISDSLRNTIMMDAKNVALIAYRGLQKDKAIIIPGYKNKLCIMIERFIPRAIVRRFVAKILQ